MRMATANSIGAITQAGRSPRLREDSRSLSSPCRILVAEQDDNIRDALVIALRADGYEVIEETNGFDLLNQLGSALLRGRPAEGPDAIIMDALMPGVSGLSILGGLRQANWQTPVVLIARQPRRELREESWRLGATALFEEPFDIDDLRTLVLNVVPSSPGPRLARLLKTSPKARASM